MNITRKRIKKVNKLTLKQPGLVKQVFVPNKKEMNHKKSTTAARRDFFMSLINVHNKKIP